MRRNTPEAGSFRFPICVIGEIELRPEPYWSEKALSGWTSITLTTPLLVKEGTYLEEIVHFEHCSHSLRHGFQKAESFEPPEKVSAEKVINCPTVLKVTDS